jgi:hypothetical protein
MLYREFVRVQGGKLIRARARVCARARWGQQGASPDCYPQVFLYKTSYTIPPKRLE